MTLLYRSPNVQIDDAVWHVTVDRHFKSQRVTVTYRWRKHDREQWRHIADWQGRLPKALQKFFQPYKASIRVAAGGADVPSAYATARAA